MRKSAKLFSIILSAVMVFSSLPVSALAEEIETLENPAEILEETAEESEAVTEEEPVIISEEENIEILVEKESSPLASEITEEVSGISEDDPPAEPVEEPSEESGEEPSGETSEEESSEETFEVPTEVSEEEAEILTEEPTEESSTDPTEEPADESSKETSEGENPELNDEDSKDEENLEAPTSGYCGENVTWTFNTSSHELVISGEGPMYNIRDVDDLDQIWFRHRKDIYKVTVNPGVTTIGESVFHECVNLTSVSLPETISIIEAFSFYSCKSLTNINIPYGVTVIGTSAFSICKSLTELTLPNSLIRIEDNVFNQCENLRFINIPLSVEYIGADAFRLCNNLENIAIEYCGANNNSLKFTADNRTGELVIRNSGKMEDWSLTEAPSWFAWKEMFATVVIKNGATSIGNYAFWRFTNLKNVTIGTGVTTIGDYAFSNCEQVTEIVIPNGVTSIGDYAFSDCKNLKIVTIPSSVTSIGEHAFDGSENVTLVYTDYYGYCGDNIIWTLDSATGDFELKGTGSIEDRTSPTYYPWYEYKDLIRTVTVEESIGAVGYYAFSGYANLEKITLSADTILPLNAYVGCSRDLQIIRTGHVDENLTWSLNSYTGELRIVGEGNIRNFTSNNTPWFSYNTKVKYITLDERITSIGDYSFSGCINLSSAVIPSSVTSIGKSAFLGCEKLSDIDIPASVTSIGKCAFYGCNGLADENGLVTVNNVIYSYCGDGSEVIIPIGTTEISDYVFSGCEDITAIKMPASVKSLGHSSFANVRATLNLACNSTLTEDDFSVSGGVFRTVADHTYYDKVLFDVAWSADNRKCTSGIKCGLCDEIIKTNYPLDVRTSVKSKANTEKEGTVTYTASVVYDGKTYSVTKDENDIPKMVVTAPTAKNLTYTGSAQTLINRGTTNAGTLMYSPDGESYSKDLPEGINVGIYRVYYKVVVNSEYASTKADYITVNIVPEKVTVTSWANVSSGIKLTWSKVTGATGYVVYRGSSKIATISDANTLSYTDTAVKSISNTAQYTYFVRAFYMDNEDTVIYGSKSTGKVTRRMQTPSIKGYSNTSTGIKLTWGAQAGATGYAVYRDGVKIKTTTATSFTDTADTVAKAVNGKSFKYTVKAYFKSVSGNYYYSGASAAKTAYRVKAPATFTVTAGTGSVTLKFSKVPTGMSYQIYRATSKTGTYSLIKTVSAGSTYYKNTGLTKGRTYYYKVRAYKTINSVKVYSAYTAVKYATVN
ncbi:MAG: fibronectin type III domain-containing protein [Clostridia bacterium]|nr:fibronectin type III domain-containing protein [Clostridia bacterium]